MPSHYNKYPTPAISLTEHSASLPKADIPDNVDHATQAIKSLNVLTALSADDLADNAIWRDSLALTGTLRTFLGAKLVARVWSDLCDKHKPRNFSVIHGSSRIARLDAETSWVEARFSFNTNGEWPARCSGVVGIIPISDGSWKIWLLSTILEQPEGFPDVDRLTPNAVANGSSVKPINTSENDGRRDKEDTSSYVDCLVVGAGIGGLCMAGRLKALKISYVVIEKHANVGDTWVLDRYESVKLHTSKSYSQMPGEPRTFGPEDPYNLSGQHLARGFQRYVDTFSINVLTSTMLLAAVWDRTEQLWELSLRRDDKTFTMKARHVVLAAGNNGIVPKMPSYPNRKRYQGDIVHGLHWKNAQPWKHKKGIVVGSANTAHDVISDMAKADLEAITMIQRRGSRTFLLPLSTFSALVDPVFNESTPVDLSDRMLLSYPLAIQRLTAMAGIRAMADTNPSYFDDIEAQGFNVERYGDLWGLMYDREGGHFFDLGAGGLIANGRVKVRSDAEPVSYTESGLAMSDGSVIDADVIVFATGYTGNLKSTATKIFGEEIGHSLQEFWQCDIEGESRGAWKDTGRK